MPTILKGGGSVWHPCSFFRSLSLSLFLLSSRSLLPFEQLPRVLFPPLVNDVPGGRGDTISVHFCLTVCPVRSLRPWAAAAMVPVPAKSTSSIPLRRRRPSAAPRPDRPPRLDKSAPACHLHFGPPGGRENRSRSRRRIHNHHHNLNRKPPPPLFPRPPLRADTAPGGSSANLLLAHPFPPLALAAAAGQPPTLAGRQRRTSRLQPHRRPWQTAVSRPSRSSPSIPPPSSSRRPNRPQQRQQQ